MGLLTLLLIEQCHFCFYGNGLWMPFWNDRNAEWTQTHLWSPAQHSVDRGWDNLFVPPLRCSHLSIAECCSPVSAAACGPVVHKVFRYKFELQMDCSSDWSSSVSTDSVMLLWWKWVSVGMRCQTHKRCMWDIVWCIQLERKDTLHLWIGVDNYWLVTVVMFFFWLCTEKLLQLAQWCSNDCWGVCVKQGLTISIVKD